MLTSFFIKNNLQSNTILSIKYSGQLLQDILLFVIVLFIFSFYIFYGNVIRFTVPG
jgi:hypothetical protein